MWKIGGLLVLMGVLYWLMIVSYDRGNEKLGILLVISYAVSGILLVICVEWAFLQTMPAWGKVLVILAQLALLISISQYNRKIHT